MIVSALGCSCNITYKVFGIIVWCTYIQWSGLLNSSAICHCHGGHLFDLLNQVSLLIIELLVLYIIINATYAMSWAHMTLPIGVNSPVLSVWNRDRKSTSLSLFLRRISWMGFVLPGLATNTWNTITFTLQQICAQICTLFSKSQESEPRTISGWLKGG